MRIFIALVVVFTAGAVMAQAYRWVDENGVVHYSDRPQEGAERIILPQSAGPSRAVAAVGRRPAAREEAAPAAAAPFSYDLIEVVAPAPEETLWNLEGVLNVSLRVSPALRPGDQVRVYFDGEMRQVSGTSFQLQEVYRGVHNIQAEVLDSTGQLMGRSLPNRFYVQQNTIVRPK